MEALGRLVGRLWRRRRRETLIVLAGVVGIILLWALIVAPAVERRDQGRSLKATFTPRVTSTTSYKVWLRCDECEEVGLDIYLWSSPSKESVIGGVPNKTQVTVLETRQTSGMMFYRVQIWGKTGWVSQLMVTFEKPD